MQMFLNEKLFHYVKIISFINNTNQTVLRVIEEPIDKMHDLEHTMHSAVGNNIQSICPLIVEKISFRKHKNRKHKPFHYNVEQLHATKQPN